MTRYKYLGDRLTDPALKSQLCTVILRPDDKTTRGQNGSQLVQFDCGRTANVTSRLLRKIKFN